MKFYLNCGMVAALLLTVSLVRVSLTGLVRGRERSTERLEGRSPAPSLAAGVTPRTPEVERNRKVVAEIRR